MLRPTLLDMRWRTVTIYWGYFDRFPSVVLTRSCVQTEPGRSRIYRTSYSSLEHTTVFENVGAGLVEILAIQECLQRGTRGEDLPPVIAHVCQFGEPFARVAVVWDEGKERKESS